MAHIEQIKQELADLDRMDTDLYNEFNKLGQLFNKETDEKKRKQINDKMSELYRERQAIQKQITKLENQVRQQKIEESTSNSDLQKLAAELKKAEEDYEQASVEFDKANRKEDDLQDKLDTMNEDDSKYDDLSEQLDDATVARQRLSDKLDTKLDKVNKLKAKIDKWSNRSISDETQRRIETKYFGPMEE